MMAVYTLEKWEKKSGKTGDREGSLHTPICKHMFGKAQVMSSPEIATLSEYSHMHIAVCPKTTREMTYH